MNAFPRAVLLAATLAVLGACGEEPFGPLTTLTASYEVGNLVFTATSDVPDPEARTFQVTVRVVNEGSTADETSILGGACMLRPRLYDNANGELVWSTFEENQACDDVAELIALEAGEERLLDGTFTADVSDGSYLVTVTIEHGGALVELAAGNAVFR